MAQRTGSPYLPARPNAESECFGVAKAWAIVSLLLGIIGFLIQPIVVGPLALTAGVIAVRMRSRMGWWGIGLGTAQLLYMVTVLSELQ